MGQRIAGNLTKDGAKVTLLEGPIPHAFKSKSVRVIKFQFFDELKRLLREELRKKYDIIIHAAAVSDYLLSHTYGAKLSSGFSNIKLELVPTEKLIEKIKKICPGSFLVGFKLESDAKEELLRIKAGHLIRSAGCDLVVANCLSHGNYRAFIFDKDKNIVAKAMHRRGAARALVSLLKELS